MIVLGIKDANWS